MPKKYKTLEEILVRFDRATRRARRDIKQAFAQVAKRPTRDNKEWLDGAAELWIRAVESSTFTADHIAKVLAPSERKQL